MHIKIQLEPKPVFKELLETEQKKKTKTKNTEQMDE